MSSRCGVESTGVTVASALLGNDENASFEEAFLRNEAAAKATAAEVAAKVGVDGGL